MKHKATYKPPNIHDQTETKKDTSVSLKHHHKMKIKQEKLERNIFH